MKVPAYPYPVCGKCCKPMRCVKNSVVVSEKQTGDLPVSIWRGDRYACRDCGNEIITGFGSGAVEGDPPSDAVTLR